MSAYCSKCGTFVESGAFCTTCGARLDTQSPSNSQQAGIRQPYAQPYSQSYAQTSAEEEMSLGKWVGTILLTTMLGLISFVLLFIWAFGEGPVARKNYCKAMLIVTAISIGASIVIMMLFGALIMGNFSEFGDAFQRGWNRSAEERAQSQDYSYNMTSAPSDAPYAVTVDGVEYYI